MLYGRIQTTFIQDISASAPGDLGLLAISNSNDGRTADDNQEQEVLNNYQFPAAQLTFLRPLRRPISDSSHQLGTFSCNTPQSYRNRTSWRPLSHPAANPRAAIGPGAPLIRVPSTHQARAG